TEPRRPRVGPCVAYPGEDLRFELACQLMGWVAPRHRIVGQGFQSESPPESLTFRAAEQRLASSELVDLLARGPAEKSSRRSRGKGNRLLAKRIRSWIEWAFRIDSGAARATDIARIVASLCASVGIGARVGIARVARVRVGVCQSAARRRTHDDERPHSG